MRVAIVNCNRRRIGGAESYIETVANGLTERGHELAFVHEIDGPSDRRQIKLPAAVPVFSVSDVGSDEAIAQLKSWKPDLIFSHGLVDRSLESATLGIAPAIFFAHGYYGTCISGSKTWTYPETKPCDRKFGFQCLLHYYPHRCGGLNPLTMIKEYRRQDSRLKTLQRYRMILTNSLHMQTEFRNHGLNAHAVRLIVENGRPPSVASEDKGWKLLFAGRMDRLKGGHMLLDSIPLLRKSWGQQFEIVFVGDGPARKDLEARASRIRGNDGGVNITFTGWVEREEYDALLRDCHLLVVPSLWPEPFGLVGLEAGSRGIPAAAFNVGGISDWLNDGVNGFLATGDIPTAEGLAQAITRCLSDKTTYARPCAKGQYKWQAALANRRTLMRSREISTSR